MSVQTVAGGAMAEGHDVVASLRVKRQELLEEVGKMQVRGCICSTPMLFHKWSSNLSSGCDDVSFFQGLSQPPKWTAVALGTIQRARDTTDGLSQALPSQVED